MKNRSIVSLVILSIVTLGIYTIYWFVVTKGELNEHGASIPTAWFLIIPFVSIYWMWLYFTAAEKFTNGKANALVGFLLGLFITPVISAALCQDAYNNMGSNASISDTPYPNSPNPPATPTPLV